MDNTGFFAAVLPLNGLKCLAVPRGDGKGWKHYFGQDAAWAQAQALRLDARGANVYLACAGFHTSDNRQGANVAALRAFWTDIDAGPTKPYPHKRDAAKAVLDFTTALGLPQPWLVQSGNGIHVWWAMDADMTPDEWRPVAEMLKQACVAWGLKADPSRTSDIASVLRPVGTFHRKGAPIPVKLLRPGAIGTLAGFRQRLEPYLAANNVPVSYVMRPGAPGLNAEYMAGIEYAPSSAERIAEQCAVMAKIRDTRGAVDQPTWYASLSILDHTVEGPDLAHEWSKGDRRYSFAETQRKLEQARGFGPATCEKFGEHNPDLCAACPHKGTVKSPITLGVELLIPLNSQACAPVDEPPDAAVQPPAFPANWDWRVPDEGEGSWDKTPRLCCRVFEKGEDDKKAVPVWKPFCRALFYPVGHTDDEQDGHALDIKMHVRGQIRTFQLATKHIAEGRSALSGALGKMEIVAMQGQDGKLQHYLKDWIDHLRMTAEAHKTRQHFGWQPDDERTFTWGKTLFTAEGDKPAILSGNAKLRAHHLVAKGDFKTWRKNIHALYAHPGMEAYQFLVMLSFAAPLMALLKQYGGVTVYAHSDSSGVGKSSAQFAGLSAWGDSDEIKLADNAATINALWGLVGMYRSLPVVYDEMTNVSPAAASALIFTASSGRGKERLGQDGTLRNNSVNWSTILMASGNNLLSEKLTSHRADAEAELSRLFEFTMRKAMVVSPLKSPPMFQALRENYGHAGPEYIKRVIAKYDVVCQLLSRTREEFDRAAGITHAERYRSALAACVLCAAQLCDKWNIVRFDRQALEAWLYEQIAENRQGQSNAVGDAVGRFGDMLADLQNGMLVTQGEGDLRKGVYAVVLKRPYGPMTGRGIHAGNLQGVGPNDAASYVSQVAIKDWCVKKGVSMREMRIAAVAAGLVKPQNVRFILGKGTAEYSGITGQVNCWDVDPVALNIGESPVSNNVVMLKPALVGGGDGAGASGRTSERNP